jgi:cyclopropane fatty-acyl-phospholipid synthase-like methyltransferase
MENQGIFPGSGERAINTPAVWWKQGINPTLVRLVENGQVKPCRAIELGCGSGKNLVFLAKFGFDITGVENSSNALELSRKRLKMAGVSATLLQDEIIDLKNVHDSYDLLLDVGQVHDLPKTDRQSYLKSTLDLTHAGSQFFLYCYEWRVSWWERLTIKILSRFGFGAITFEPGEVDELFGPHFDIAQVACEEDNSFAPHYPRGYAVYLMTRKRGQEPLLPTSS